MPRVNASGLANSRRRVKSFAYTCSRNTLACINFVFILVGLALIGTAAYGAEEAVLVSVPALSGVIGCGAFLILVSMFGFIGAVRHNQVILFFYMIISSLLFVLLLAFSITALAVTEDQQHTLILKAWKAVGEDQKLQIEKAIHCCGFDNTSGRNCTQGGTNFTTPCYEAMHDPLKKTLSISGGIGLFFSFALLLAVYCTVRYRNQKDPKMSVDAFL